MNLELKSKDAVKNLFNNFSIIHVQSGQVFEICGSRRFSVPIAAAAFSATQSFNFQTLRFIYLSFLLQLNLLTCTGDISKASQLLFNCSSNNVESVKSGSVVLSILIAGICISLVFDKCNDEWQEMHSFLPGISTLGFVLDKFRDIVFSDFTLLLFGCFLNGSQHAF